MSFGVVTTRLATLGPQRWASHAHDVHELLWDSRGLLTVLTEHGLFSVPPMAGVWIDAGVEHEVLAGAGTQFYCSYLDAPRPAGLAGTMLVAISPALHELLVHLDVTDLDPDVRARMERVVVDLVAPLDVSPPSLPVPLDPYAARVARHLLIHPDDPRSLEQWGRAIGCSARSLSRRFSDETGMSFARWRLNARVRVAVGLLAAGYPVSVVARRVGYATASAFVYAFHQVIGQPPGSYRADASGGRAASA